MEDFQRRRVVRSWRIDAPFSIILADDDEPSALDAAEAT